MSSPSPATVGAPNPSNITLTAKLRSILKPTSNASDRLAPLPSTTLSAVTEESSSSSDDKESRTSRATVGAPNPSKIPLTTKLRSIFKRTPTVSGRVAPLPSTTSTVITEGFSYSDDSESSEDSERTPSPPSLSCSDLTLRQLGLKILEEDGTRYWCTDCGQQATPDYALVSGFWSKVFVLCCAPCVFARCCSFHKYYESLKTPMFVCSECKSEVGGVSKDFDPYEYVFHYGQP